MSKKMTFMNQMVRKPMAALAVGAMALTFAGTSAEASTIVQNGSFEQDAGTGAKNTNDFSSMVGASGTSSWDIFTSVPGWTASGGLDGSGDGLEIQTAKTIPLTPFDGDYYAELDGDKNATISQSISLSTGRYSLSFGYSPRDDSITTNVISYGISTLFQDTVNGPAADVPQGAWTEVEFEFVVATAGEFDLFFDAAGDSDSVGGFVDDVAINAVPLPAGGLLLLTALGGVAALRRRRKAV